MGEPDPRDHLARLEPLLLAVMEELAEIRRALNLDASGAGPARDQGGGES